MNAFADCPRDSPVKLGSLVSKYRIVKVIGSGGCAWVFQATDNFLGRDVAIKILHRIGGVTPEMLHFGQAEAQLLTKLRHVNIVEIFDAGMTENGLLFIVMELLVGRSLFVAMHESERMTEAEALPIFRQVADAMAYAHSLGAIHRDLKPENIFVTKTGVAKVLDFGIAKIMDDATPMSPKKDGWFGTLLYMSPEQVQCVDVSFGSDIYSLGILFWEVLGGVHPLLTDCVEPSDDEIAMMHTDKVPPSIHRYRTDVSQHLSGIIDHAISKKASERYANMSDFADALRECLAPRRAHNASEVGCDIPATLLAMSASMPIDSTTCVLLDSMGTKLGLGALAPAANRTSIGCGERRQVRQLQWRQALLVAGLMGMFAFGIAALWLLLLKPRPVPTMAAVPPMSVASAPNGALVLSATDVRLAPRFLIGPGLDRDG